MTHTGSPAGGHWLATEQTAFSPPLSAFYFAEMLDINAVFQTQSALFPVFSFSLPFPFTAPATALRCFNEAETLKALIWRSLRSR